MDDALEKKKQRLEALRKRKEELERRKKEKLRKAKGLPPTEEEGGKNNDDVDDDNENNATDQKNSDGPNIEMNTFVGVLNIRGKDPVYKYDRGISVTKEDINLMKMLQQEEEVPVYEMENETDENEEAEGENKEKNISKIRRVPEKEVERIFASKNFRRFVRKGSAELNDALEDTYTLIEDVLENENPEVAQDLRERISKSTVFRDETKLENHMCSDVQWCVTHAEWFLGVYNALKTEEHMGKVVIWNLDFKGKPAPAHILYSTKKINRAVFNPQDENIIYGGLSSGQVVVWDLRVKNAPILKTKPTLENHNLPIFCLEMINDGRRDLLLSISYEGRLCLWNPSTLTEPELVENLTFKTSSGRSTDRDSENPLAPMISLIAPGLTPSDSSLIIGTYDSIIQRYKIEDIVNQPEEKIIDHFQAHFAPVCSISYKTNPNNRILDGLLVSGSFDFTIQIWKPNQSEEKIHSLELHEDYITAVDWNPIHHAMIASADCTGKICIWDLLEDKDYPVYITQTDPISCMKWHPDGMKLIIGTLKGEIQKWNFKKRFLKVDERQQQEFEDFVMGK